MEEVAYIALAIPVFFLLIAGEAIDAKLAGKRLYRLNDSLNNLACSSFNTLYQFWVHRRAIGRLGPLEWVLNTPSHHRVTTLPTPSTSRETMAAR